MVMSSRITSTLRLFARRRSIAEDPSAASNTSKPFLRSILATACRKQSSSSTTKTAASVRGLVDSQGPVDYSMADIGLLVA